MRPKDALGRHGEQLAAQHLQASGLEVLDRNWRCPDGEIDIVAREGDILVICEVKTRTSPLFGDPVEAVGPAKAARIHRLAMRWMASHTPNWRDLRFDVVSVLSGPDGASRVRHLRGGF